MKNAFVKKTKTKRRTAKAIYTKREFNSGDGMLTAVWGPSLWHSLHTISFNYPVEPSRDDKSHYKDFIMSLRHILPCKYCRMNLHNNLKSLPLKMSDMKSRETFLRYIYNLHELINKMLKKKSGLTYADVRNRYEHFRARCNSVPPTAVWNKNSIKKNARSTMKQSTLQKGKNGSKTRRRKSGDTAETGCTEPLYEGSKSKCIIKIVPQETAGNTFQMDKKCKKKKLVPG